MERGKDKSLNEMGKCKGKKKSVSIDLAYRRTCFFRAALHRRVWKWGIGAYMHGVRENMVGNQGLVSNAHALPVSFSCPFISMATLKDLSHGKMPAVVK